MTGIETILFFAVAALAAHVLILQRHYSQQLSDQAMVLAFLVETIREMPADPEHIEEMRDKIFNSSQ